MALQVKCVRCDRTYSAFRLSCPYCGAARFRKTHKRADTDNTTWSTVIGAALALVLVIGVATLVMDARKTNAANAANNSANDANLWDNDHTLEKNIDSIAQAADDFMDEQAALNEGEEGEGSGEEEDPNAGITMGDVQVESVKMFLGNRELNASNSDMYDYDISIRTGEALELKFTVVPESLQAQVQDAAVWSCNDTTVLAVLQSGKITGLNVGVAYLTCSVGNAEAVCIVRVR